MTWHTAFWDDDAATGVVEYSYEGHHRYHGAAIVRIGADDRIARWREWQHLDDVMAWDARLRGPADSDALSANDAMVLDDDAVPVSIDHIQLGMPSGGEPDARAFYGGVLGPDRLGGPPVGQGDEHHEAGLAFDQGADRRALLGRRRW